METQPRLRYLHATEDMLPGHICVIENDEVKLVREGDNPPVGSLACSPILPVKQGEKGFFSMTSNADRVLNLDHLICLVNEKQYRAPTTQSGMRSQLDGYSLWENRSMIPVIALEDLQEILRDVLGLAPVPATEPSRIILPH